MITSSSRCFGCCGCDTLRDQSVGVAVAFARSFVVFIIVLIAQRVVDIVRARVGARWRLYVAALHLYRKNIAAAGYVTGVRLKRWRRVVAAWLARGR